MHPLQKFSGLISAVFKLFSSQSSSKAWWVRIKTEQPDYTYYFGPYETRKGAEINQSGFVEDLQSEGAIISATNVMRCNPSKVTIEGNHLPA
ncbi:MAG: DUF1816 domain-containing protein [Cyanobacteria bacterium P01_C01_bin.120]